MHGIQDYLLCSMYYETNYQIIDKVLFTLLGIGQFDHINPMTGFSN